MTPPRVYHVSPLPSFCTVPARPQPSLPQALWEIVAWWRGRRPSLAERIREEKKVEKIAELLAEEDAKGEPG
jgi:hypothetical protein